MFLTVPNTGVLVGGGGGQGVEEKVTFSDFSHKSMVRISPNIIGIIYRERGILVAESI